ncbi:hypothetical protein PR048_007097 [Dryococelus australis]|uniref:PiggyBac transposable element-derived protein domain-containing protein n=1 Tax=Dryococelus australis TaxID=614101 RepID=A0ABQ9IEV6_9NEOP|nr:hypothetical protein PR048_007097 [Dryococelus australis]
MSDAKRTEYKNTNLTEFKAFLGILIFITVFKSNDLEAMFATDGTGRDIFRCTMSLKREYVLLLGLRFDDASDRNKRKKDDATAPTSWVFHKFMENCKVDARTHNLLGAYKYAGKDNDGRTLNDYEKKLPIPTQAVLRLAEPIVGTNRNITTNSLFSSINLVKEVKERDLTNEKEMSCTDSQMTCRWSPVYQKKGKAVLLVSSMHHTQSTQKPKNPKSLLLITARKVDLLLWTSSAQSTQTGAQGDGH